MNRKNFAIRALVMLLCVTMLIGMVPISMSAAAADVSPVLVLSANHLRDSYGKKPVTKEFVEDVGEGGKSYIRFTVPKDTKMANAVRAYAVFDQDIVRDFKYTKDTVAVIYYRTNASGKNFIFNPMFVYNDKTTKLWCNKRFSQTYDAWEKMVISFGDLIKDNNWSGGESGITGSTATDRFNSACGLTPHSFLLNPFGENKAVTADDYYYDVEYIAFFNSTDDATNYNYVAPARLAFKNDDGSVFEIVYDETNATGKVVLPDTDPTSAGKKFTGWVLESNGEAVTDETNVADICAKGATVEIIPTFVEANTISFKDGENVVDEVVVEVGKKVGTLPEAPAHKGYTFVEWVDENENAVTAETVPAADAVYTAKYTAIEEAVKVVYMLDDTNVFKLFNTNTDETLPTPETDPTRVGYTFEGWDVAKADGVVGEEYAVDAIIGAYLADGKDTITVKPVFTKNDAFGDEVVVASGYYIYTADNESITSKNEGAYSGAVVNEGGKSYIHYTTSEKASLAETDKLVVNFAGTPLTNVPVMKMGYRTNATRNPIDVNLFVGSSRLWGAKIPDFKGNDGWQTITVDLSKLGWYGGNNGWTNWSSINGKDVTGILLRPFAAGTADNYFDISYVSFFATVAEANKFDYSNVAIMNINGKSVLALAGDDYKLPEAPVVPNKNFDYYEDEEGKPYEAGQTIKAKDGLKLTAVYKDAESFKIEYYDADGTLLETVPEYPLNRAINHADYATANAPAGQEFSGWFYEGSYWEIEDGYVVDRDM